MNMYMGVRWMSDKFDKELTEENFKDYILEIEKANLRNIVKDDKNVIVARIVQAYEEARKNDNK